MPKVIKKKAIKKRGVEQETDVKEVITKAKGFASRENKYFVALVAVPVLALIILGVYYYRGINEDKAHGLFSEGLALYYGTNQPKTENVVDTQRFDKAIELFKKSIAVKESSLALYYLANSYYVLGKYDDAIKTYKDLNSNYPDDERFVPLTYYKMAMASAYKGSNEDALKYFDTLYNYKTEAFKDFALVESARLLDSIGKKEEARSKYELIVKKFPSSSFFQEAQSKLSIEKAQPQKG